MPEMSTVVASSATICPAIRDTAGCQAECVYVPLGLLLGIGFDNCKVKRTLRAKMQQQRGIGYGSVHRQAGRTDLRATCNDLSYRSWEILDMSQA